MRNQIYNLIKQISPIDNLERDHIQNVLDWIDSGVDIFRIKKHKTPPKHLVSYAVVIDIKNKKVLLTEHKKSGLWLPTGGHVEINEHPKITAERELKEELSTKLSLITTAPLFLTVTETVGNPEYIHTDVSLWYLMNGDCKQTFNYAEEEFHSIKWFDFDKIPYGKTDEHFERFMKKLKLFLEERKEND